MNKNHIFGSIMCLIISAAFVSAVYLAYRPSQTQIVTGAVIRDTNGGAGGYQTARSPLYEDKNGTQKKNTASLPVLKSLENGDPEESLDSSLSGSENLFNPSGPSDLDWEPEDPSSDSNSDSDSSKDKDGDNTSSDSDNTSSDDEEPNNFEAVAQKVQSLSIDYSIDLMVNSIENPVYESHQFQKSNTALRQLGILEDCLSRVGVSLLNNLASLNGPVDIQLYYSEEDSVINAGYSGDGVYVMQIFCGTSDWSYQFFLSITQYMQEVLAQKTDIWAIYEQYESFNPSNFEYGSPDFSYIATVPEKTYFLSVEAQVSVDVDLRLLYVDYLSGAVPNRYWTEECPLYQKLLYIQQCFDTYITV